MAIWGWFSENAFNLLSALGVIASLLFTASSFRSETKTRRIANLLSITANHREAWKIFLDHKELGRIRKPTADTRNEPVTETELIFVGLVIHHAHSVFRAMNDHLVVKVEGFRRDVREFFALPVVRDVWERIKNLQNDDFADFIESCRNEKG